MSNTARLVTLEDRDVDRSMPSTDVATKGELQELTKRVAFDPGSWGRSDLESMRARFNERASTWATRDAPEYRLPLEDALGRGRVAPSGLCLEVGSGTGIQTPTLVRHFDRVLCTEVAPEMFRHTPAGLGTLLLADASSLPLGDRSVDAIVCVNAPLFAPEYARVLGAAGAVVFVSTRGEETPIYLAPADVLEALRSLGDGGFSAKTARAGQGTWTVARRLVASEGGRDAGA